MKVYRYVTVYLEDACVRAIEWAEKLGRPFFVEENWDHGVCEYIATSERPDKPLFSTEEEK